MPHIFKGLKMVIPSQNTGFNSSTEEYKCLIHEKHLKSGSSSEFKNEMAWQEIQEKEL